MNDLKNCLFCQILADEIPSEKVYEDEFSYAFLDINPVNKGHTLIIPKEHHENIYELPDELLSKLFVNVKNLAGAVREAVSADGVNIGMNNGEASGQVIFHAHIHIMPRFKDDGHEHWQSNFKYSEKEAKEAAKEIQAKIK